MSQKLSTLNTDSITYSASTRHLLYNNKPFTILTPSYTTKSMTVDENGNTVLTLNSSKNFNEKLMTIVRYCYKLAKINLPKDVGKPMYILDKDVGFYDIKSEVEKNIPLEDYKDIFNRDTFVKLEVRFLGFNKSNRLVLKVENCGYRAVEKIEFKSSSEIGTEDEED